MRQSENFLKALRVPPSDEESFNGKLLSQAGFIKKLASGVYNFLPLGNKVLSKIENIVREEINIAGGAELLMPALHPKENWQATGRWESFDALFRLKGNSGSEYALGPTHEEILYPLLKHYIKSYKDLPLSLYQIQTKFRNEPRAKSGLLRGREFRMKDLYSFHEDAGERDSYYDKIRTAYKKIFKRLGLQALQTEASGGTFSELSLEFQVPSEVGEDTIFLCLKCGFAINHEISGEAGKKCKKCGGETDVKKSIEVGNIFPLKEKYAEDFNLTFKDKNGEDKLVQAGCYGLGTSRAMGAIVETSHDKNGIIWPKEVSPFPAHLISLSAKDDKKVKDTSEKLYKDLLSKKMEVLYDDDDDSSPGEKFANADLLGIPLRIVISPKTIAKNKIEIKERGAENSKMISFKDLYKTLGIK